MARKKLLLSSDLIKLTIQRLCHQLIENHKDFSDSVILGLQPRGVFFAEKIKIALKEITEATYLSNFHALAEKNWENITERKGLKKNKKFVDFLLRKGYETSLIYEKLNELNN